MRILIPALLTLLCGVVLPGFAQDGDQGIDWQKDPLTQFHALTPPAMTKLKHDFDQHDSHQARAMPVIEDQMPVSSIPIGSKFVFTQTLKRGSMDPDAAGIYSLWLEQSLPLCNRSIEIEFNETSFTCIDDSVIKDNQIAMGTELIVGAVEPNHMLGMSGDDEHLHPSEKMSFRFYRGTDEAGNPLISQFGKNTQLVYFETSERYTVGRLRNLLGRIGVKLVIKKDS